MEKKQAIELISDTFNAKFDENRFSHFIKNLLNDIELRENQYSGQMLWDDYKEHINYYKRIGKYTDPEGEPLDVLIVEVKTIAKLERARTSLRNFVIKHLKKFEKDFALVAFYAKEDNGIDWRFSFIKLEYQSYPDEKKGKIKIKEDLTPAKRYSFLVGECEQSHTAKTQLLPLLQNVANNPTVEDLENAFSIEKVTDEFFEQYKDLFKKLSNHFTNNSHIKAELNKANIDNTRFTKKLLGQIVFLYFLQKKGWLGVPKDKKWGDGQKRFIQNLFDTAEQENVNFFKDKLQHLFYEALAKERENDNSFYEKFDCRIPFLNGGLFEAEYKWETANISIPENIFRNQEKNKAGDKGTGVLDVFDRYNFTIKEDEPLDKEVAVDPEMLGKVFENMLEITERKSKGAFYTPREIVHYMCQESLIHYLDNALEGKVKKQDIETYIRKGHNALENDQRVAKKGEETATYKYILPKSIRKNADLIDQKLIDIKICDPAIGSGAFPVGLLHELVNAQLVIKPHFSDNYLNAKLKEFGFTKKEITSESRYIYRLKRHIIQESIYGVDIDASAIDIARLRLWLSLVVDEDDFEPIETLPNLDYKIVCGNSLISRYPLDTPLDMPLDMPLDNIFKEFNKKVKSKEYKNQTIKNLVGTKEIDLAYYKKLTNDFLLESSHEKKVLFRELITEIKSAFTTTLGKKAKDKLSKARGAIENLQKSDIFSKQVGTKTQISNAKKHFAKLEKEKKETEDGALFKNSIEWRFEFPNLLDEEGDFVGFDVVIGNPPYISYYGNKGQKLSQSEKSHFLNNYAQVIKENDRLNSMNLMSEKAIKLINTIGFVTFITNKTLAILPSYVSFRKFILDNTGIDYLITNLDPFDAIVDCVIFGIQKHKPDTNTKYFSGQLENFTIVPKTSFISNNKLELHQSEFENVLSKIENLNSKLEDFLTINRGVNIGGCFDDFLANETKPNYYKYLRGTKNIKPYYYEWDKKDGFFKFDLELEKKLKKQGATIALGNKNRYEQNRLFIPESGQLIMAALSKEKIYGAYGLLVGTSDKSNHLTFSLLLLNSELFSFYAIQREILRKGNKATPHVGIKGLRRVPVPVLPTNDNINIIPEYLNILFSNDRNSVHSSFFNSLANSIVYELYFEPELKQANKQVLKHLTDLKPIDDTMSEEEKMAIIQAEFERLHHPEHPVRFAVENLDSIEEVRIIKEALR